ncbi:FliO/MopB family protein [Coprothermobacteraceae bacterium]|nr:FliO/MopB family protein [Coprothermobacteraceae bacterium]
MNSFLQFLSLTLFFVIVIALLVWLSKYSRTWLQNFRLPSQGRTLKVLDAAALDFKSRVFIVEAENQKFFIVDNGSQIRVVRLGSEPTEKSEFQQLMEDAERNISD